MIDPNTPIAQLKNLGPKSAEQLAQVGILNYQQLLEKGAIESFELLCSLEQFQPSLNFLYAMLGAIENKHWTEYKQRKGKLLLELENRKEFRALFDSE
ncbi:MAG: TfoX/Sxy family protein [Kangiellaceae bacterium]|nr:TfoX/Sxy family protein [Kangiellaceae bacterium]MCW8999491.1 TfoX/Sxy family protein [Kangiellaceae bacterium]MCW9016736.1 TfoX/Sxy family protein [Kangiellaceae bacterium]